NNYFIGGPATPKNKQSPFSRGNENFNSYQAGNYYDNNQNGILDGNRVEENDHWYPGLRSENFKTKTDYADYPSVSPALQEQHVLPYVMNQVGATRPKRDQVDELLIQELKRLGKSGRYVYDEADLPLSNGGLGTLSAGQPLVDTDEDGIPDRWEEELGLDKNDPSDALKRSKHAEYKGYLNIEVYLHRLAEE